MIFRAEVRDCLQINWTLAASDLSAPPAPLAYDVRRADGGDAAFVSALLFYQQHLHWRGLPSARLSYPQFQLHFSVLDGDGAPALWIVSALMPAWVAPGARWVSGQPAKAAQLDYPGTAAAAPGSAGAAAAAGGRRWRVRRRGEFVVEAAPGAAALAAGPRLGSWEETLSFFRRRPVGYTSVAAGLRRVEVERGPAEPVPMRATVVEDALLRRLVPAAAEWRRPHSAWLSPSMNVAFALGPGEEMAVRPRVPAPSG